MLTNFLLFSASIVSRLRERILHKCVCFNVPGAIGPGVPLCTLVPRDVQFKKKKKRLLSYTKKNILSAWEKKISIHPLNEQRVLSSI